jgi:hypothetical protein
MDNPLLTLMLFPQRLIGAGTLEVRVAALPFTNPLASLAPGQPAFGDTDLAFDLRIIPSLAAEPRPAAAQPPVALPAQARTNRHALLKHLQSRFKIATNPAPAGGPPPPPTRIRKYLPVSYREAFSFEGPQHDLVCMDDAFRCALESPTDTVLPPYEDRVTWGEVLGHLLRNSRLSEEAGLFFRFDVEVADAFASGGWLYAELRPGTAFSGLGKVRVYAARIPALGATPRPVFAPLQFLVDGPAVADDAATSFIESEAYADGFAKIPHGAQPVGSGPVDTEPGGPPPARDRGIRLGWDDEQVTTWLNRQIGFDPVRRADTKFKAPLTVLGYRVDVREAGGADWTSLVRIEGHLGFDAMPADDLGPLDLGHFETELTVETIPVNPRAAPTGDFWLPAHFVAWAGGSLVLTDPAILAIDAHDAPIGEQPLLAVGADAVPLRYGRDYEFRVRLVDLSGGGPEAGEKTDPATPPAVAPVKFRRYVPPRAPRLVRADGLADPEPPKSFELRRPRLGYPDIAFALGAGVVPDLVAERDRLLAIPAATRTEEVGLPDPDVASVRISVAVRQLRFDEAEYVELYSVTRDFPLDAALPLPLDVEYVDVHDVLTLPAPDANDPLRLPTAREVRLSFQSVGRADALLKYFGTDGARFSASSTVLTVRVPSTDETALFVAQPPSGNLHAIYLQPDPPVTGFALRMRAEQGVLRPPDLDAPHRLARDLDLECDRLTLWAKAGRRTLFGASAGIRHALAPDHASITFGAQSDLIHHWIVAVRVTVDRDWTWDALVEQGVTILRNGNPVGTVDLPRIVNARALDHARRTRTELIFFDAIDTKPPPGAFPTETSVTYDVRPRFRAAPAMRPGTLRLQLRLPITTPPVQTPKLVSAGLAFTPFVHDERYASTQQRRRALWLEFDGPPTDPNDRYYCRVLATAPDPMLILAEVPEPPEPDLPIDPELIRVVVPGQSADDSGLDALQELPKSTSAVHFMVPLPPNTDEASLDLFGFFTYELRVGHDATRWSTAQGRFGPPLRVTGVQHPPPPLSCQVSRDESTIHVHAPFATPVLDGRPMRPSPPRSDMWVLLYAQVLQVDGASWRNVLLLQTRASRIVDQDPHRDGLRPQTAIEMATGRFSQADVEHTLGLLGLAADSSLSVLAVELLPESALVDQQTPPRRDPLRESLGDVRVLRASPLVPVQPIC